MVHVRCAQAFPTCFCRYESRHKTRQHLLNSAEYLTLPMHTSHSQATLKIHNRTLPLICSSFGTSVRKFAPLLIFLCLNLGRLKCRSRWSTVEHLTCKRLPLLLVNCQLTLIDDGIDTRLSPLLIWREDGAYFEAAATALAAASCGGCCVFSFCISPGRAAVDTACYCSRLLVIGDP